MFNYKNMRLLLLTALLFSHANIGFSSSERSRVWIQIAPQKFERAIQLIEKLGGKIHHRFSDLNAISVSLPKHRIRGLFSNADFISIEEDAKRYASAQSIGYGIDAVQAREMWDANRDGQVDIGSPAGSGKLICVIDSGLHVSHEDMVGVDLVGGYPQSWNVDICGHGTHVAGTIAAANNTTGVVGVSPGRASLFIVKVFGGTSCEWTYSSDLVDAANRCQDAGADIINMSLAGEVKIQAEERAFSRLNREGVLSIAAAGNKGDKSLSYPAAYDAVVSVGAVDQQLSLAGFSQQNSAVELVAPGVDVISTVPFVIQSSITANGVSYKGSRIELSAQGEAAGVVVDGGLCDQSASWTGQIVLCERGEVSFLTKILNVQSGGGLGAVIYNNVPGSFNGTLGDGNTSTIPVIGLSRENGIALLGNSLGLTASLMSTLRHPASGYEARSGTSMSVPHVSAVAALVWSSAPNASNKEVRDALRQTALDLGDTGRDKRFGYGFLQAYDAWQYLGGAGVGQNQPPVAGFTVDCSARSCLFDASASHDADGNIVAYDWEFGDTHQAMGAVVEHVFQADATYAVSLTVRDNEGVSNTSVVSVNSGGGEGLDTIAPQITSVQSKKLRRRKFEISWETDEGSSSVVSFACCGEFVDTALRTEHSTTFRGVPNATYEYWLIATDEFGNQSKEGPFIHQH